MLLSTTEYIPQKYRILGLVEGYVIQDRGTFVEILSEVKSFLGGSEATKIFHSLKEKAKEEMLKNATLLGANGVIAIRFQESIIEGKLQIFVYGTAIRMDSFEENKSRLKQQIRLDTFKRYLLTQKPNVSDDELQVLASRVAQHICSQYIQANYSVKLIAKSDTEIQIYKKLDSDEFLLVQSFYGEKQPNQEEILRFIQSLNDEDIREGVRTFFLRHLEVFVWIMQTHFQEISIQLQRIQLQTHSHHEIFRTSFYINPTVESNEKSSDSTLFAFYQNALYSCL
ncbi:hypothetical protein CCZ01_06480 [Helicobacter monodelphidis]|uniref:heavy metal-binding domain-containing protein n=1 Tax=Helicobacter sp. 15-1451 TaxID=2004995 RepID=UPI000DCB1415|nr:heavy metal-binding domain-containing protein [Helicobacter sp. 15-1451]RAX57339.1 hypothetical protein CCZ01_06480 [Helicobacter sp. 15-1451]